MYIHSHSTTQFAGCLPRRGDRQKGTSSPFRVDSPRLYTRSEIDGLINKKLNKLKKQNQIMLALTAIMAGVFGGNQYQIYADRPKSEPLELKVHAEKGSIPSKELHESLAALLKANVASNVMHLDHHSKLAQYARPLVVAIQQNISPGADTVGSGFFYQGRFIVTNQHVIDDSKDGTVPFRLLDGRSSKARIIGQDEKMDVAVLEMNPQDFGLEAIPSAEISPEPAKAGESIIAIGNPLGELEWSTTLGIVSSVNRHQEKADRDFLQIDAAINGGNSGGPAFNMAGDVIGMNTLKTFGTEGIAFSIEGHILQSVVDKMIQEHAQKKPQ